MITLRLIASLLAIDLWSWLFRYYDLGRGRERGLLLAGLTLILVLAARTGSAGLVALPWRWLRGALVVLGLGLGLGYAALAVFAVHSTWVSHDVALDQGQDGYRAALYLRRGHDPYGKGALLDRMSFADHLAVRTAAGAGPLMAPSQITPVFEQYWRTLDDGLRAALAPVNSVAGSAADLQVRLLGYKYGPVPVLLAVPLVGHLGPAAIEVESILACLGLFWCLAGLWRARGLPPDLCALGLLAALCEIQIPWNFIWFTATDVWPLAFGFAGLWAQARGRQRLAGILIAAALASKIFPGAFFLLALLRERRRRELLWFAGGLALLWGPFLVWDARGFVVNNLLWGGLVAQSYSVWLAFVPVTAAWIARGVLGLGACVLALRVLTCPADRVPLFLALLAMAVIAAGKIFHNNYVPWFSCFAIWFVLERAARARVSAV